MKLFILHSKEIITAIIAGVIIAIISTLILDYIYFEEGPDESHTYSVANNKNSFVPQLWSHHKILDVNTEECAIKGKVILETLGFASIIKNDKYVYGNLDGNRAT